MEEPGSPLAVLTVVVEAPWCPGAFSLQAWHALSRTRHLVVVGADGAAAALREAAAATPDDHVVAPAVVASAGDVMPLAGMTVLVGDPECALDVTTRAQRAGLSVHRIDPPAAPVGAHLLALVGVEQRLLGPGGCPWDREQTHRSLARHLLEESYEVLEAIDQLPAAGDAPGGMPSEGVGSESIETATDKPAASGLTPPASPGAPDATATAALVEELGDLLLQVVFHAELGRVAGQFDIDDVARTIRDKLVRRHPHVFAQAQVANSAEVVANWETIKREQEGRTAPFSGIPAALPALQYAAKVQSRAVSAGLTTPVPDAGTRAVASLARVVELAAGTDREPEVLQRGVGELLDDVVMLARTLGVDAEGALRRWTRSRVAALDPPSVPAAGTD